MTKPLFEYMLFTLMLVIIERVSETLAAILEPVARIRDWFESRRTPLAAMGPRPPETMHEDDFEHARRT